MSDKDFKFTDPALKHSTMHSSLLKTSNLLAKLQVSNTPLYAISSIVLELSRKERSVPN